VSAVVAKGGAGRAREPERVRAEPWLSTVLRVLVHAVVAAVFAWPLTVAEAVVAASVGAATGALLGRFLSRTRARLPALLGGSVAVVVLAGLLREIVVGTDLLAPSLGPATALRVGDAVQLGVGALALSTGIRVLSSRHRAFAVLEVGFVGVAFAQLVVAHRQGAIHRPFEIADPIIASGGDPTIAMLAVGAGASLVVVLLLLSERSLLRSFLHMFVVVAVLLLVFGTAATVGLPQPPPTGGGLGLRPDEEEQEGGDTGRGQGSQRNNEQLEFRDNYDSEANRVPLGVVLLHDDYSPPSGVYYFRQGAFSQYNGRRLVKASRGDVDRDIAPAFPAGGPLEIPGAPEPGAARATLETTVALLAEHTRPFALESPLELRPSQNPDARRFRRVYRSVSASLTADLASMLGGRAGDPSWTPEQWAHYTEAPEDPRYRELAREILDERLPDDMREEPIARAAAITSWLGEEGVYSLRSSHADAEDPTASFLFGDRTGYCVHFAHAGA